MTRTQQYQWRSALSTNSRSLATTAARKDTSPENADRLRSLEAARLAREMQRVARARRATKVTKAAKALRKEAKLAVPKEEKSVIDGAARVT